MALPDLVVKAFSEMERINSDPCKGGMEGEREGPFSVTSSAVFKGRYPFTDTLGIFVCLITFGFREKWSLRNSLCPVAQADLNLPGGCFKLFEGAGQDNSREPPHPDLSHIILLLSAPAFQMVSLVPSISFRSVEKARAFYDARFEGSIGMI